MPCNLFLAQIIPECDHQKTPLRERDALILFLTLLSISETVQTEGHPSNITSQRAYRIIFLPHYNCLHPCRKCHLKCKSRKYCLEHEDALGTLSKPVLLKTSVIWVKSLELIFSLFLLSNLNLQCCGVHSCSSKWHSSPGLHAFVSESCQ